MSQVNILKYEILSAQGDLSQTLSAIKNEDIKLSSKIASILDGDITVPYFLLENVKKKSPNDIYNLLKNIVSTVISDLDAEQRKSTALILGTCLPDLNMTSNIEANRENELPEYSSEKTSVDTYARKLCQEFALNDFSMTISTACTSSANAILEAQNFLKNNIFENVVVVGAEISLKMINDGFSSMKLLAQKKQKPFDKKRDGLILGEAIGAVLLGKGKSSFSLEGGFTNCDSINITSVSEDGSEYVDVMKTALQNANITTKDITALKAHATGTHTNDLSEINAISKLFSTNVVFTALKPYIGHTLGACGVVELCIFIKALEDGFIPKALNHSESILDDYSPLIEHKKCDSGIFMLNYFGFGGNNTSLIIKKEST